MSPLPFFTLSSPTQDHKMEYSAFTKPFFSKRLQFLKTEFYKYWTSIPDAEHKNIFPLSEKFFQKPLDKPGPMPYNGVNDENNPKGRYNTMAKALSRPHALSAKELPIATMNVT